MVGVSWASCLHTPLADAWRNRAALLSSVCSSDAHWLDSLLHHRNRLGAILTRLPFTDARRHPVSGAVFVELGVSEFASGARKMAALADAPSGPVCVVHAGQTNGCTQTK